ncbi:MAG: pitrilysin family protein [Clostridia bacterium]
MPIEEIKNGVFLNIAKSKKYKTNYISLGFLNNLSKEMASLCSLLVRVIKSSNNTDDNLIKVTKRLENLYGAKLKTLTKKVGETHLTYLSIEYLNSKYTLDGENIEKDIFAFLNDMLNNPYLPNGAFSEKTVATEKENLIDSIKAKFDDKMMYSLDKCTEIMCSDEAYSACELGDIEIIKKITPKALLEFYQQFINNSTVYINFCGSVNEDYIKNEFKNLFSDNRNTTPLKTNVVYNKGEVKTYLEKLPIAQGKLTLGFRTKVTAKDDEFINLLLFNTVFGSSPNSRLFENVREKLSLCYYCSSMVEKNKGVMFVYSGVESYNKEKAVEEILFQLEDLKNGNISENELIVAKNHFRNTYKSLNDDNASMSLFNIGQFVANTNVLASELVSKVDSVTALDIKKIASEIYLDTEVFISSDKEEKTNE